MEYIQDPNLQLRKDLNGLTLIQINPDIAIDVRNKSENYGWIFEKEEEKWKKLRKLDANEIDQAWDQISDMAVLDASAKTPKPKRKM